MVSAAASTLVDTAATLDRCHDHNRDPFFRLLPSDKEREEATNTLLSICSPSFPFTKSSSNLVASFNP